MKEQVYKDTPSTKNMMNIQKGAYLTLRRVARCCGLVSLLWLDGALALLWLGGGLVLLEDLAATVGGEVAAW